MKYEGREESTNVEDQRGKGPGPAVMTGGILGAIVLLLATFLGVDPRLLQSLGLSAGGNQEQKEDAPVDPRQEDLKSFSSVVLKDTETIWGELFQKNLRRPYKQPKLVLFTGAVQSACGFAKSAVGPFYCPGDDKVYLDLGFFDELTTKLGAKNGKFGMAYVIAHEIGHHVQNQVGPEQSRDTYSQITNRARKSPEANEYSVRLELQADYLAGVWTHYAEKQLKTIENGDISVAMDVAHKIGDDTLQKKFQGYVRPESFTHGSAKARMYWYNEGYRTGSWDGMHRLFTESYQRVSNP